MEVLISVIIPFYSNIKWLKEAVDSVLNQTYQNFEIIVINDGSKENDEDFIKKYSDFIKYHKTENAGPAAARNKGIKLANGEYIAFLDSDDIWKTNKLKIQLDYMLLESLIWSHTAYELFTDHDNKTYKTIDVNHFKGDVFIPCLISSPIATPCVMVKTEFLRENPTIQFAENMRYGQDGFMWLNIARHKKLGVINESLTKVRMRGGNAALRARVYLQVKAQMWSYIKSKKEHDKRLQNLPLFIKSAYKLSYFNNRILLFLENKNCLNAGVGEFISKILYTPTFILLKLKSQNTY
ncbi:glycosyltransferase family 2 protein [Flavimarina sp. Hel_I_48]|uniref:glycosyltransferase family 2 protein n=1 Tax=Flavimarina sp. Hel_I_48 TaxID=1392488 RepID=UPI0004DF4324|nr:glycosyltransferase [Flavimarina sp. Hel_I_48]